MILFLSLIIAVLFSLVFQKQLKKHPGVFYGLFIVVGLVVCVLKYFNVNIIGFWGTYVYSILDKSALGTAFFVLVMYAGAFKDKTAARRLFISIRRQLSVIACILTFAHNIAYGKTYFKGLFVEPQKLQTNVLLAAICSVIMIIILIPLFVTSFISVRKKMNPKNWKKLQRLAYIVYALIYVHVMLLNVGAAINGVLRNQINVGVYTAVFLTYLIMRILKAACCKDAESKVSAARFYLVPAIIGLVVGGAAVIGIRMNKGPEAGAEQVDGTKLKDGIYTVTEFGYVDDITLVVEVENGEVTKVYFQEYKDDATYKAYGDYQLGLINANPMGEVDAITGATYSTTAIKKAYEKALSEAMVN